MRSLNMRRRVGYGPLITFDIDCLIRFCARHRRGSGRHRPALMILRRLAPTSSGAISSVAPAYDHADITSVPARL